MKFEITNKHIKNRLFFVYFFLEKGSLCVENHYMERNKTLRTGKFGLRLAQIIVDPVEHAKSLVLG